MLTDDTDPMVSVMKLEKAPDETYADIGGLDQQIQEIKVCLLPGNSDFCFSRACLICGFKIALFVFYICLCVYNYHVRLHYLTCYYATVVY